MTGEIFEGWLRKWSKKLMVEKRSVLLIINNCPAHPRDLDIPHIIIKFLPPNTTSRLQPCDQGILRSLKAHYRQRLVKRLILSVEAGEELKISVLDAMHWLRCAWDNVTSTKIASFIAILMLLILRMI